jgi:hypothetical protein
LPQSLHLSRTFPEILLYFGFIVSSSAMHSITLPQSHENSCFTTATNLDSSSFGCCCSRRIPCSV